MKYFEHTPGPWANSITGIINKDGRLVAQCNYATTFWNGREHQQYIGSHSEFCGNGNLIAASPELLESLIDVVKLLRIYSKSTEPSLNGIGVDANIFNRANSLIRELTGEDLINETKPDQE